MTQKPIDKTNNSGCQNLRVTGGTKKEPIRNAACIIGLFIKLDGVRGRTLLYRTQYSFISLPEEVNIKNG